jgi:hypothetical protein
VTPAPTTLTSEEAQRALDILQDAKKRDEQIETLRSIVRISPSEGTRVAAAGASPAATADGFGTDVLSEASTKIGGLSAEFGHSVRATTKFPMLWRWLINMATDPYAQHLVLSLLWRAAAVTLLAVLVERAAQYALDTRAARDVIQAVHIEPLGHDLEATSDALRVTWLRRTIARTPHVVARLALELLPIAAFAAVNNSLLATSIGEDPGARVAILALVNACVVCGAVLSVLRAFIGSSTVGTSLFTLRAETVMAIEVWTQRIVGAAVPPISRGRGRRAKQGPVRDTWAKFG